MFLMNPLLLWSLILVPVPFFQIAECAEQQLFTCLIHKTHVAWGCWRLPLGAVKSNRTQQTAHQK